MYKQERACSVPGRFLHIIQFNSNSNLMAWTLLALFYMQGHRDDSQRSRNLPRSLHQEGTAEKGAWNCHLEPLLLSMELSLQKVSLKEISAVRQLTEQLEKSLTGVTGFTVVSQEVGLQGEGH